MDQQFMQHKIREIIRWARTMSLEDISDPILTMAWKNVVEQLEQNSNLEDLLHSFQETIAHYDNRVEWLREHGDSLSLRNAGRFRKHKRVYWILVSYAEHAWKPYLSDAYWRNATRLANIDYENRKKITNARLYMPRMTMRTGTLPVPEQPTQRERAVIADTETSILQPMPKWRETWWEKVIKLFTTYPGKS